MKVFFTAIGGSDPIKRMLDGPMLHCLRVYKPDVVYMYFTKKMLEYERLDNRYTWAVEMLGRHMGHKFDIKIIERENLTDVQKFDIFYGDFEKIFEEIEETYPDAELFANASSGTPAIKSGIIVTAAMSKSKINVIQVSSGENRPLHDRDKDENYDKEVQWECDEDNNDNYIDRTSIVASDRFLVKVKKENIKKYIDAYDYQAALAIAEEIKEYIPSDALKLISAAVSRFKLDYNGVTEALSVTDYMLIPVKDDRKRNITEYLLWLGIILERGDYLGFIRGITPAAMALMEETVKVTPVGDIKKYCKKINDGNSDRYFLTRDILCKSEIGENILEILDKEYSKKNGFNDCEYTTAQLEPIIKGFCDDDKVCECASVIRKAEFNLRNQAAHTIIAVGDELIKRRIGMTAKELYDVIKKLATKIGLVSKSTWNSYMEMNELIIQMLYKTDEN